MAEYILKPPSETPQQGYVLKPPQPQQPGMVEDAVKSIPGIIPRAVAGFVGFPQSALDAITSTLGNVVAKGMGVDPTRVKELIQPELKRLGLPNAGEVIERAADNASKAVTGSPFYRPQTGAGRVVDMVGQTMVYPGGTMLQKVVTGGAAGLSGEAARASGVENPLLLGVVQMLGGTAASLPFILRSVPAENINQALKNVTPDQLARAQQLMNDAARMGSPITGAEAIAQITGKNSLQDIQRVVESSKQGAPIMQPMMNQRPDAARKTFADVADRIGPMPQSPAQTPVKLQEAAQSALTEARRAGNTRADPFYKRAETQSAPLQEWQALRQNAAVDKALNAVKNDPIWGVSKEPEGSIRWLDAAKRWIDDQAQGAQPSESRIWKDANTALKAVADRASPDYAQARAIVAQNQRDVVQPMRNSPVGDIAETGAAPGQQRPPAETMMVQQSGILMPESPRALNPKTIRESIATLNAQDPNAARDFARQNIQAIFNESTQKLQGGANQWGAAKFASKIAGNVDEQQMLSQRDNLQALIESVGGPQAWRGFNRMLEVFEAQGKRHAPGSQTEFNKQISGDLSQGGLGTVPALVASPQRALSVVADYYDRFRYGKNTAEMAEILTNPQSVEKMRMLARESPSSSKALALTAGILASQQPAAIEQSSNANR